jgi:hypothetical protein
MKSPLFKLVFAFSLLLNAAVVGTVGWHLWRDHPPIGSTNFGAPEIGEMDFREMRKFMNKNGPARMGEIRRRFQEKKEQVLDIIAGNPSNLKAAEPHIQELLTLRSEMEREALTRISKAISMMPPEKRGAFVAFLKKRSCGPGMMPGGRRGRPGNVPVDNTPCPVDAPCAENNQ